MIVLARLPHTQLSLSLCFHLLFSYRARGSLYICSLVIDDDMLRADSGFQMDALLESL